MNKSLKIDKQRLKHLRYQEKEHKKYLRYKKACDNMQCDKIVNLNTIDDILWCMVNCQFSYDYNERMTRVPG